MNLHDYLSVAPEIAEALAAGKPVVALESTILTACRIRRMSNLPTR